MNTTQERHSFGVKAFVALVAVGLIVAGCTPTSLNLTPSHAPASTNGFYAFEVQWDSPRRGANSPEVKAYVVIETNLYPMTRIANTPNRWEALAPLPPGRSYVPYHYKFDYQYPELRQKALASDLSEEYHIVVPRN